MRALTVVVHPEHAAPRHAVVVRPLWLPRLRGHSFLRLLRRTRPQASWSRLLRPERHGPTFNTCRCCIKLRAGVGGRVHADNVNARDTHGTFCSIWAARYPPRPCPAPGFRPLPCLTPAEPPAHPLTHHSSSAHVHAASHASVALDGAQMLQHSRLARLHPAAGFRPLPFPPQAEPPVNVLPHEVGRSSCSQLSTNGLYERRLAETVRQAACHLQRPGQLVQLNTRPQGAPQGWRDCGPLTSSLGKGAHPGGTLPASIKRAAK